MVRPYTLTSARTFPACAVAADSRRPSPAPHLGTSDVILKLQPDRIEGVNSISAHAPGIVRVAPQGVTAAAAAATLLTFEESVVVPWQGEVLAWQCPAFDALTVAHFERIAALSPEVVVFGSGARLRFAPAALLRPLLERRIGVETMDTAAACRTYNVLVGERRSVVAALLL
jgi:uncharacterized protein